MRFKRRNNKNRGWIATSIYSQTSIKCFDNKLVKFPDLSKVINGTLPFLLTVEGYFYK